MYCPSCGNSVKKGLKFCNSCGTKLGKDDDGSPAKMLNDILETLFWTAILGLGILVGLVAVMLNRDVRADIVGFVAFTYLFALFGICFMLARQVPKLIDARLRNMTAAADSSPVQIAAPTTAQLDEYREPVISVTDHTTKTLDKVPRGQGI